MNNIFYCPGDLALFNTFDLSYAPTLLYYSYIPIVIASLFLAVFILIKKHFSLESKLLFSIAVSFSLWVVNIMMQWITVPAQLNYFEWQITPFIEILIPIFSLYFVTVFLEKKDAGIKMKLFLSAIASSVFILLPTSINAISFDVLNCQANLGPLIYYVYGFEVLCVFLVLYIGVMKYRSSDDPLLKKQILFFIPGVMLFLGIFSAGQIFGEITKLYEINLIGPIGMLCFIGILAYMIVKYQTFNIKTFATQVLFIATTFLIGSLFFTPNIYVIAATFILFLISGIFIIQSVKREIKLREELAITNKDLETANKGQENLIHIINHQIKGYLATARNIFAELSQSTDYGQMPEASVPLLTKGFEEMGEGVEYVQGILKSSSAQSGTLPYDMKPVDLKAIISTLVSNQKVDAEQAGLSFESTIADGDYAMTGDALMLEEMFKNLITNAIRYNNPNGSIAVTLSHPDNKILFTVKDTGLGITEEDQKKLFTSGGMGKDSMKHNANASGYGLAFVKPVVEKHQGKIWYETEVGKGTTFFVELPIEQTV